MRPPRDEPPTQRTLWQRMVLRRLVRKAGKRQGEPLSADDWQRWFELGDGLTGRLLQSVWRTPSRTESEDSEDVARLLRRFYGCAERVLFPEAIIDKVVGDEVMALYLPDVQRRIPREAVATLMVDHAMQLLRAVGYGSEDGPFVDVGIGLDVGEAFVGNIGERAVYDFTAVGDVVNTASRLQSEARGGEIVLSQRVAEGLPAPIGSVVELQLKGKARLEQAYRVGPAPPRAGL